MHTHQLINIAAVSLMFSLTAATAQTAALPRTADGKPNVQGIWQASGTAAADLQDHAARFNMPAGRSVVTGSIPYQPWAAAKKAENFQNRQKDDPLGKCYIPGVPRVMYLDFPFQIFQTPQVIAMTFEWSLDYRLIYTNGTPHPPDTDGWMGDSRGRWDGDTLVVDRVGFDPRVWLDIESHPHSDKLHIVERYHRPDLGHLEIEITVDDPGVLAKPWTQKRLADLANEEIFEFICTENNRDIEHLVGK